MKRALRLLFLPLVAPLALLWIMFFLFIVLLPAEILAFSLMAVGESRAGDAILEGVLDAAFFETPPWTWLRGR